MKSFLTTAALLSGVSAMCNHGTRSNPRREAVEIAEFKYTGTTGPLGWHGLAAGNAICATGDKQSPIDVSADNSALVGADVYQLNIPMYVMGAKFENLGSTLEVVVTGEVTIEDKVFELQQFHFHTPSEHHVGTQHYPMEVHFVLQDEADALAVLGFMIEVADTEEPSALLESVFSNVDAIATPGTEDITGKLDFSELATHLNGTNVFQYSGSLTTPPCDQEVAWNVVEDPIFISTATYRKVKGIVGFNSRYPQNTPTQVNLLDNARNILQAPL